MEIRTDKEFKAFFIQMINELRRRMNEHSKKYITRYKKNQSWRIQYWSCFLQNVKTLLFNSPAGINSRLNDKEEWISELGDKVVELTQVKQNKRKNIFNEHSLRDLYDHIKHTKICIIGVLEGGKRERSRKSTLRNNSWNNFSNLGKETDR